MYREEPRLSCSAKEKQTQYIYTQHDHELGNRCLERTYIFKLAARPPLYFSHTPPATHFTSPWPSLAQPPHQPQINRDAV
jgi:hypothetical protein